MYVIIKKSLSQFIMTCRLSTYMYILIVIAILMFFVYGIVGIICGENRDECFLLPFYREDTLLLELSGYNYGIASPTPIWYRVLSDGRGVGVMPSQYFADAENLKSWYIFSKDQITDLVDNVQDKVLLLQLDTDIMPTVRDVIRNKQLVIHRKPNQEGWWFVDLE